MADNGKLEVKVNYGETLVLKLVFGMADGATMTWNIKYPKNNLTMTTVQQAVEDNIIDNDAIRYKNAEADSLKDAYIYRTATVQIPDV